MMRAAVISGERWTLFAVYQSFEQSIWPSLLGKARIVYCHFEILEAQPSINLTRQGLDASALSL